MAMARAVGSTRVLAELAQDFRVLWEAAVVLALLVPDHSAVDGHQELPFATGPRFDLRGGMLPLDAVGQTGRARQVVSKHAVVDRDVHPQMLGRAWAAANLQFFARGAQCACPECHRVVVPFLWRG